MDPDFDEIFREASALADMLRSSNDVFHCESPESKRRLVSDTITISRTSSRLGDTTEQSSPVKRKLNLNETFHNDSDDCTVMPNSKRVKPNSSCDFNDNTSSLSNKHLESLDIAYSEIEMDQLLGDFDKENEVDVNELKKSAFSNCDNLNREALVTELEVSAARALVEKYKQNSSTAVTSEAVTSHLGSELDEPLAQSDSKGCCIPSQTITRSMKLPVSPSFHKTAVNHLFFKF